MKNTFFFVLVLMALSACQTTENTTSGQQDKPFYERSYALPVEAREWAAKASLNELCQGTKNWRPESIREASLNEIKARDIDTRECYYTGMELTP